MCTSGREEARRAQVFKDFKLEKIQVTYTPQQVASLLEEQDRVQEQLAETLVAVTLSGHQATDARVKEHLLHGAGRRLGLLRECLNDVFDVYPPDRVVPLESAALYRVQIDLHAFVINLSGLFDNLAWAFVLRHSLETAVGDRLKVGIFKAATQKFLPPQIRGYVTSAGIKTWQKDYLTAYRDALAHRVPLYIPPAIFTEEDGTRYNELDRKEVECIRDHQWEQLEQVRAEKLNLGTACGFFLHSVGDGSVPMKLHPQMLCDAMAIVEFCRVFLDNWHECGPLTQP